jgi:elongator complex protein 3
MVQKTKTEGTFSVFHRDLFVDDILSGPSQAETLLRVTSGIAAELVKAHDANQTVSLNELRAKMSKKHGFGGVPRLVDIISAIPDDYKKALLPKLRARPIRTASGVRYICMSI